MTVTVDAATEDVRTGTTSPQTFSHAGAASGVKGVLLALVHGTSATDHVSAASYGGVAMTRVQRNTDTATEPGAAEWWFLGAGVPQGTQTVSYTPGATTDDIHAVCITLLADGDLAVVDSDGVNENVANPSVTLQYNGRTCMAFGALYGGGASPADFTPNANCTTVHDHDLGAFYSEIIRQTTAGSSDFAIGGTSATDDVAFACVAVSEKVVGADAASTAVGATSVAGAALWNALSAAAGLAASAVLAVTLTLGVGASTGTATIDGVGGYVTGGAGSSAGAATVTAGGAGVSTSAASATGVASPTAVSGATAKVDAASAAAASTSASGSATAASEAASAGAAPTAVAGAARVLADAASSGAAASAVVGASFNTTVFGSTGAATAQADGENAAGGGGITPVDGTSSGSASVTGAGATVIPGAAASTGSSATSAASGSVVGAQAGSSGSAGTGASGGFITAAAGSGSGAASASAFGATANPQGEPEDLYVVRDEIDTTAMVVEKDVLAMAEDVDLYVVQA